MLEKRNDKNNIMDFDFEEIDNEFVSPKLLQSVINIRKLLKKAPALYRK